MFQTTIPTVPVSEAHRTGQHGDLILDVREPHEFAAGHVPGSTLIPLGQLPAQLRQLPTDRRVLIVCATGNRSSYATQMLQGAGHDAHNIDGGMAAWQGAGLPIER